MKQKIIASFICFIAATLAAWATLVTIAEYGIGG